MNFENLKVENEINREERELAEGLAKAPMDISNKIELLLVWRGLKLADDISIVTESWKENEPPKKLDLEQVKIIENLVKNMKLSCLVGAKQIVDGEYSYKTKDGREELEKKEEVVFYLAKEKENLDLLTQALKTEDSQLLGRLYGFPKSSIDAFAKEEKTGEKQKIDIADLLPEVQKQDSFAFARFKLSKDNWREELKTGGKWAQTVKSTSPKLYDEYVEFMSKVNYQ